MNKKKNNKSSKNKILKNKYSKINKQLGAGNGYYPDFNSSPCGGTLMYDTYTNHLSGNEYNDIVGMQKLDNVANLNGGRLRNPKTNKWVPLKSKEGLGLCREYLKLLNNN